MSESGGEVRLMTAKKAAAADPLPGAFFGPANLLDLLAHRMRFQGDDTAYTFLVDGEEQQVTITYRELDRQARAIAGWLQSRDLTERRALLFYPPGLEFIAAFFGCLYANVVPVPLYPPRPKQSLARVVAIVEDAEATLGLTTEGTLQRIEPLIDAEPALRRLAWFATGAAPAGIEDRWTRPAITGESLAFLQYTSGSTGRPKGVMLSHANLMHNSAIIGHVFEHTRSGSGVFWLPSYHDMGLIGGILQPLWVGRPNVIMSPMAFLQKPYRWLSAISRFRGTTSGGPNFAYDLCVRKIAPEERATLDLSCWTVAFNGAEPVRAETLARFAETFAPCGFRWEAFYPCYGLAEATLIVSGGYVKTPPKISHFAGDSLANGRAVPASPEDARARKLVGCGSSVPDEDLVIADPDTLTRCEPGQIGEIWARSPSVALGYWRQPEVSQTTFRAFLRDSGEGPYLRTGDLGFLEEGELYVTGRLKDIIIVHGRNHYPQDIELSAEKSHHQLRPGCGAAFSLQPDDDLQLVVVQEVQRNTPPAQLEIIYRAIRRAVWHDHELGLWAILLVKPGGVPRTSSGKVQRHACRAAYLAGTLPVVGRWHPAEVEQGAWDRGPLVRDRSSQREGLEIRE
jgi:acyl-CoA synthetase (AMP-forming)/AMP-acid ligase II